MSRIRARSGLYVHDAQLDDIAGFGITHVDRAGADVHPESFAGAASQQLAIERTGTAPVHALLVLGPQIDAFRTRIALDHALGVVVGVMSQGLDGDIVTGIDLDDRLEQLTEIAPVEGFGGRRQIVIGWPLPSGA